MLWLSINVHTWKKFLGRAVVSEGFEAFRVNAVVCNLVPSTLLYSRFPPQHSASSCSIRGIMYRNSFHQISGFLASEIKMQFAVECH